MYLRLCVLLLAMVPLIAADLLDSENLRNFVLQFHNDLRANEGASDMIKLVGSPLLLLLLLLLLLSRYGSGFWHSGEGAGGQILILDLIRSEMQRWFDEKSDFRRHANGCGSSCHYTQVNVIILF
eukprot:XP_014783316.1 PREDICTED: uncharacterized protein LOC106878583 [Octopus bimaculoides]